MAKKSSSPAYDTDLAFIHDAGFGHVACAASDELLDMLKRQKINAGTVVELGCGSGILSDRLAQAGFDVVGYDISPAMVELARKRVPATSRSCSKTRRRARGHRPLCVRDRSRSW